MARGTVYSTQLSPGADTGSCAQPFLQSCIPVSSPISEISCRPERWACFQMVQGALSRTCPVLMYTHIRIYTCNIHMYMSFLYECILIVYLQTLHAHVDLCILRKQVLQE